MSKDPNRLIHQYLVHSYIYYHLDDQLISDEAYDKICKDLLEQKEQITHPYARFIDVDALAAGTAYHIQKEDYPESIHRTATGLLEYRAQT